MRKGSRSLRMPLHPPSSSLFQLFRQCRVLEWTCYVGQKINRKKRYHIFFIFTIKLQFIHLAYMSESSSPLDRPDYSYSFSLLSQAPSLSYNLPPYLSLRLPYFPLILPLLLHFLLLSPVPPVISYLPHIKRDLISSKLCLYQCSRTLLWTTWIAQSLCSDHHTIYHSVT